jgi:hypothetical protein
MPRKAVNTDWTSGDTQPPFLQTLATAGGADNTIRAVHSAGGVLGKSLAKPLAGTNNAPSKGSWPRTLTNSLRSIVAKVSPNKRSKGRPAVMDVEYGPSESVAGPVELPYKRNPVRQVTLNQRAISYDLRQEQLAKAKSKARPDGNWFVESRQEDSLDVYYVALLEFKAWKSINWEKDWVASTNFTPNARKIQRQIRKYVVTYECPYVILWDGETLLLLLFDGLSVKELESRQCKIVYWVIEYSKTDGRGKPEMLAGLYWILRKAIMDVCPFVQDSKHP